MNRITGSNYEESLKAKLVNRAIERESLFDRIFYFGQVISNSDPKNLNRIKIRIPEIDDALYVNKTKDEGDASLPHALPFSHRFVEIPEVNSIVVVAVFDPKVPYYGRMYFDTVTELSDKDVFDRLTPESASLSDFTNIEKAFNVKLNSKPKTDGEFNAAANVDYEMGIRGKGDNKFVLDKDFTYWSQNEGSDSKRSFIKLNEDPVFTAANTMQLISTKGSSTKYNPVFHTPLHDYLASINKVLQKIVMVLNTVPAISPVGPCTSGPMASQLLSSLQTLATDFSKFKSTGHSKKLIIN